MRNPTPEEIGNALRNLNNKKSSGPDGIPNFVLRKSGRRVWGYLAVIFNNCLNTGYFPGEWKHSRISPIIKPGKDPTDAANYRPIALNSNVGKLFEVFILERLNNHMEGEKILRDFQFGFRKQLSTTHALMAVSDGMARGFNNRRATIALGLDFEKAFDTVWREGIVYKMKQKYGFDDLLTRIIYDYLMERTFAVTVEGEESRTIGTKAGVP